MKSQTVKSQSQEQKSAEREFGPYARHLIKLARRNRAKNKVVQIVGIPAPHWKTVHPPPPFGWSPEAWHSLGDKT
jgi:hypothetical protein